VVKNTDLVVGDLYLINMGDKVIADGVMLDGFHLVLDEASLTGGCCVAHSPGER
jgi:Ca2+-transporting ATPase